MIISVEDNPDVTVAFDNVHDCSGTNTAVIKVVNTGNAILDSVRITFTNRGSGQTIFGPFTSNGPFMGTQSECPPGGDSVGAGKQAFIGGGIASASSGSTIDAVFLFCNQEDLNGTCVEKSLAFIIP